MNPNSSTAPIERGGVRQMPSIVANTPPGTQAAMIAAVLAAQHPKLALPTIASNFSVTLADLQTVLQRHGYPDRGRLQTAAAQLRAEAVESADRVDTDTALEQQPATSARVTDLAAATEDRRLARVTVADLHPDPANLRGDTVIVDDIEQLADSIRENGLLQPIVARTDEQGRLFVVAGHRRLAAVQRLRWTHVDVIIRPPMRPDAVIAAMLIENGQRRDLDPIEEARGIHRLKTVDGLSDAAVGRKIGRSQSHVSARLALLNLSVEEQEAIRTGEITLTGGTNLGRLKSGKTNKSSKGHISVPFHGPTHELAPKASARCKRLGHRRKLTGGVACGPCWESVVRSDEREHLQTVNARSSDCVTCGQPIEQRQETP